MMDVALLGFGLFGRALAELLVSAGHRVRAFDTHGRVPDELAVGSHDALVRGASIVVLAVPVPAMREAIAAIAPLLEPSQVVLDVGSVKVRPTEALAELLGARIPWVGTHPLFGPTSLALAERPLRVVLCPSPHHVAMERARELFSSIGCELLEQDAHAHDRAMAETHVLAFFVAKGMVDAGIHDVPYAPPSFKAIARTVDVVRSDAGHLFSAIQRENPYAAEARSRLLDALRAVDDTLKSRVPTASQALQESSGLAIPDLGAHSPQLREARELIDELDRDLVALLARRAELSRRAARAKAALGQGVADPSREASLLEERRALGTAAGLDPESVDDVFRAILRFSRRVQQVPPKRD